ncbi:unnamed protein product, partial [Closterium sp. NIES-53]
TLDNWNPKDPTPCSWTGVQCNPFSQQVVGLDLSAASLLGDLAFQDPPLGALTSLQRLQLADNLFSGSIPDSLSSIRSLQVLELANNDLDGIIPPTLFSNLPSLATVDLSDNTLSGPLPQDVSAMQSLLSLDVSGNRLEGPLPDNLSQLRQVSQLVLDGNKGLSGSLSPAVLGSLPSLQVISARGCSFSGFLPPALGYAPRLQSLDLGGNQLAGGIPPTWGQMGSLTSLVMNGNQLSESIPSALNGLSALQATSDGQSDVAGDGRLLRRLKMGVRIELNWHHPSPLLLNPSPPLAPPPCLPVCMLF